MNRSMKAVGFGNVQLTGLLQVWGLMVWFCVMLCSICFCMGQAYCIVLYTFIQVRKFFSLREEQRLGMLKYGVLRHSKTEEVTGD